MTIQERLRSAADHLRTKPMPLSDFIPLIQQAADALDAAEVVMAKPEQSGEPVAWIDTHPHEWSASLGEIRSLRWSKEECTKAEPLYTHPRHTETEVAELLNVALDADEMTIPKIEAEIRRILGVPAP